MPTFAENMVARLEELLLANAGVSSVTVNGRSVSMTDLRADYDYWKKKVASENGERPRVAQIDLSGF